MSQMFHRPPSLRRLGAALCTSAALLALSLPVAAGTFDNLQGADKEAFGEAVRDYLVNHPEVLVEAMNVLQSRQQQQAAAHDDSLVQANHDAIFADGASWVGGNPDGNVTVVEFIDYRCGYCRKAYEELEDLVKADGNIRFVLKEFPILGEGSTLSSRFAIAVKQIHGADAYKKVHDALITLRADATPDSLAKLARDMGLDAAPIMARMDSDAVTSIINANHSLGAALEISGTPTFVVGGTMVRGYVPQEGMKSIVEGQRAG